MINRIFGKSIGRRKPIWPSINPNANPGRNMPACVDMLEPRRLLSASARTPIDYAATSGGTTSSLTGSVSGKLPTSVIAGQKVAISQNVAITNGGSATLSGKVTAKVYLAAGETTDSNSILLTTISKSAKLKPHAKLPLHFSLSKLSASVPDGTYHIVVAVMDPTGGTISVAPPDIDLSGSFERPPGFSRKQNITFTLNLKNTGNTAAVGTLGINISTSLEGLFNDEVFVTKISKHVNIGANKPFKLTATVTLPIGDAFVVADLDPDNVFKDVNLSNNTFETLDLVDVT